MPTSRAKRILFVLLTYAGIIVGTLVVVDVFTMVFGIFPPTHDYGDPDLGWRSAPATGEMMVDSCMEFSSRQMVSYDRNEDGVRSDRSKHDLAADTASYKIAVTGDSQTDLCASNAETHAGVLAGALSADGRPATAFAYGAGRYSPLQAYLVFRQVLRPYGPDALVLNVYTGNDFYDLLRLDDRPHFVPNDSGYEIADPVWFLYDDPEIRRRSRVLFAFRSLADKIGVRGTLIRIGVLRKLAAEQGGGFGTVMAYINDLRQANEPTVGYAAAFSAQMLNQQLFFHHFPSGRDESLRRVAALMDLVRSENPGLELVMSPLPSYQLAGRQPVDSALHRALDRLPITYEGGVAEEEALYDALRNLAQAKGWAFSDNLAGLRAHEGPERLFNDFDYHLLPVASEIVGRAQAAAILARRGSDSP